MISTKRRRGHTLINASFSAMWRFRVSDKCLITTYFVNSKVINKHNVLCDVNDTCSFCSWPVAGVVCIANYADYE